MLSYCIFVINAEITKGKPSINRVKKVQKFCKRSH